jgi:hypothetical protein
VLGHSEDIPEANRWLLSTDNNRCWYCDGWNFCLLFWTHEIGQFNEDSDLQVPEKERQRIKSLLLQDSEIHTDLRIPLLFSETQGWRARPFEPLLDFLMRFELPPDF